LIAGTPWWKGERGEWYVVVQGLLFALIILGPKTVSGLASWSPPFAAIASAVGAALVLAGGALAVAGLLGLGRDNLTALPYPRDEATLVVTGPYRLVRNPIYSGLIFAAFGYALWVSGWLTLCYAALLFVFFDIKSRKEERWLSERFPDYSAYQRRVRKLIPWIY
jgi:protein-S-isoprenylcysteine O-methyltransferase Ste14